MILSRYTDIFSGTDNFSYIFNCLTRKWIKMDIELGNMLLSLKDNLKELQKLHPEFFHVLISEGFISNNTTEDIEMGINYVSKEYFSTENIEITINPTLDCNLRCWYCYEARHAKSVMSEETLHNTVKYIEKILKSQTVKTLRLSFFGGEPLLYFNKVISPIIESVDKLCDESGTKLFLSFTTNGVLLSDNILSRLQSYASITNIQVAFDGNKNEHDKIKFLSNGAGCYDRTIKNVKNAISRGFNVTVRCNYDKRTVLSFFNVVKDFQEYHSYKNLRFLFQKIWQERTDEEMFNLKKELIKQIDQNFIIKSNLHEMLGNSLHKCYADKMNNIVINYDGLVFRCTARKFEKENSIGVLTPNGCDINDAHSSKETLAGTTYGLHCKECRILPICPKCSQHRIEHGLDSCPINITELDMINNIRAAFHDLSGIKTNS